MKKDKFNIYRKVYAADGTRISDVAYSGFNSRWDAQWFLRKLCGILSANPDNDCNIIYADHLYSIGHGNRFMFIVSF